MATENERHGTLEITGIAADWDYKTSKPINWPDIPRLNSIQFNPGAASDCLVVKEKDEDGPKIFYALCENTNDQRVKYYHGNRKIPFIDHGDCTFTGTYSVIIELWRE